MNSYNIKGLVLKSTNYKDTDKIYSLLCYKLGKINVLGKGVRKISSRRAGNLDTLNIIEGRINEGRGGIKIIEEAKAIDTFKSIKKEYRLVTNAYYLVELVYRNIEDENETDEVLDALIKCLKILSKGITYPSIAVSYFELLFLKYLGYEYPADKIYENNDVVGNIRKLQNNKIPKDLSKEEALKLDKIIKNFLYRHLDAKFKSLELIY